MITNLRIAFISQEYPPETGWGGIGSYTYAMANGLSTLGIDVVVICKAINEASIEKHKSLEVHRILPKTNWDRFRGGWLINRFWPGFAWEAALRIKELNSIKRIHLVEYPEARADGFFLPALVRQVKRIARLHTPWIFIDRYNCIQPDMKKKLIYRMEKESILAADCVTSPSQAMLDLTETWIPALRQRLNIVIPNPIEVETFVSISDQAGSREIIFIGRPEKRKGVEPLVQALPVILRSHPDVIFRFIGNPLSELDGQPAKTWIQQRLPQDLHSRVVFGIVPRAQLPRFIARASLAIMPSLWENFPYAVLEAMSCGLPVIASNVGGLPEMIEDHITGLLVPPQDSNALVWAINQLLDEEAVRKRMGAAGRARVESCYSRAAVLPQVLNLYQRVATA